jgi:hypothetical protein
MGRKRCHICDGNFVDDQNLESAIARWLEFWDFKATPKPWLFEPVMVKRVRIDVRGLTSKQIAMYHRHLFPDEHWGCVVVEYACGCRQQSFLLRDLDSIGRIIPDTLAMALTNSNSYSAPDFDLDTDVNVAGLTALKSGAPALTDKSWIVNGATLSIEQSWSHLQVKLGVTSGGAAGGSQRYGFIDFTAPGTTTTWAGAAAAINSGINLDPTAADASSNDSRILVSGGTLASPVVMTNDGDAFDTGKRWQLYIHYGGFDIEHLTARAPSQSLILGWWMNSGKNSIAQNVCNHLIVSDTPGVGIFHHQSFAEDIPLQARFLTALVVANTVYGFDDTFLASASGFEADFEGWKCVANATGIFVPWRPQLRHQTSYGGQGHYTHTDNRPTEVVPTGLALTDDASGETLRATITNIASYANEDLLYFHNNSGGALLAVCTKAQYVAATIEKPANSCMIPGLADTTEYTVYATASSNGFIFSDASSTATATPTIGGAPDMSLELHS